MNQMERDLQAAVDSWKKKGVTTISPMLKLVSNATSFLVNDVQLDNSIGYFPQSLEFFNYVDKMLLNKMACYIAMDVNHNITRARKAFDIARRQRLDWFKIYENVTFVNGLATIE